MALGQAMKESVWLKKLLKEIGYHQQAEHVLIHSDNQGILALTKNLTFHTRTKHIDIQHHFLHEKYEANEIKINHCGTDDMVADVLTKALLKEKHNSFMSGMGLRSY